MMGGGGEMSTLSLSLSLFPLSPFLGGSGEAKVQIGEERGESSRSVQGFAV